MPCMTTRFSRSALFRYGRLAVPALCLAATACPAAAQRDANGKATPTVASRLSGIEIKRLAALPKAPSSASTRQDCGPLDAPKSDGGKIADAFGWGVTGEARLGAYDVVSFAGKFEAATSGSCNIGAGNVALFQGRQLVALIYAPSHSKKSIGSVQASGDKLRIFDGDLIPMPVGDLRIAGNGAIEVDSLPAAEPVCNGQDIVPNMYGKSIRQARKTLMAEGWRPVKSSSSDPLSESLHESGLIEAGGCAGTGFAFCSYAYRKGNMELDVTTFGDGESPTIAHYAAACQRSQWHPSN
jgi:hypothetical protein